MAKKPKSQYQLIKPVLRQLSMRWSEKNIARKKAKVQIQDGHFKNGNPRFRVKYICAECERQGINATWFEEESQVDHITPIRDPKDVEFDGDWTKYINALFCPADQLQILCIEHHLLKSKLENLEREISKSKKKPKK